MDSFEPLTGSLVFYGAVLAVCEVGRRVARSTVRHQSQLAFINEFLGTLQVCAMAYENGVVLKNYGLSSFFLAIALSVLIHSATLVDAYAIPCPIFEEAAFSRHSSSGRKRLLIRFLAQLMAAILAFRLARILWSLNFSSDHSSLAGRYHCTSDLRVPLAAGVLLEMGASFLCRLVWLAGHEKPNSWSIFVDAIIVPTIVVLGFTTTGMYFNPILAFSLNYGCKGVNPADHLLVYWLGPTIGWILATRMYSTMKRRW